MVQSRDMATDLGRNVRSDFQPKIVLDGQQRLTSLARVFDATADRSDRILLRKMIGLVGADVTILGHRWTPVCGMLD